MKDVVVLAGGNSERSLLITDKLAAEKYYAISCQSLTEFRLSINAKNLAAIILLFPDEFGMIKELCNNNMLPSFADGVPVIFISTSSEQNNRARLSYKADEFLIEPISISEVVKLIDDSIEYRLQMEPEHILAAGGLVLNRETLTVTLRNKKLPLHPLQVYILEFMMQNPRRPITRKELLINVWKKNVLIEDRTIDRNVKRIRDAFKRQAKADPIRTIRRVGYIFEDRI
jgi:DNA-binding response OmpR family regulator